MKRFTPCTEADLIEANAKHQIPKTDFDNIVQNYYGSNTPRPIPFSSTDLMQIVDSADCETECVLFEVEDNGQSLNYSVTEINLYFDQTTQTYNIPKVPGMIRSVYSVALLNYLHKTFPNQSAQFFKASAAGNFSLVFSIGTSPIGYYNYSNEGPR